MSSSLTSENIRIPTTIKLVLASLFVAFVSFAYFRFGTSILNYLLLLPGMVLMVVFIYQKPKLGLYFALILAFFSSFLVRHVPSSPPYGLLVESILVITYVILFLKHFKHLSFKLASTSLTLFMAVWMIYIVLQLGNPEATSYMAWFYAMRGIALLQLMIVPLALVLLKDFSDWQRYFKVWVMLSLLAFLWGFKQKYFGVTASEQHWLDDGGGVTHLLFGKLRIFSFHSDAGSFGSSMGHISIVCLVLFLGPYSKRKKVILLLLGLLFFYGLMLSGTRGALAIPAAGGILYLILIKNYKYIILSAIALSIGFGMLKFTSIGNSNYDIYRLRTALDPNDASLQIRLYNRQQLDSYLDGKPFGGGVGSAHPWGERFAPGTWLASFPPDGLYTRIRAETGIVGKYLYLSIFIAILLYGIKTVWSSQNKKYQNISMALLCGYAGILLANYGNEVMTLYPNNFNVFISLAVIYNIRRWNSKGIAELKDEQTPVEGGLYPSSSWSQSKDLPISLESDT